MHGCGKDSDENHPQFVPLGHVVQPQSPSAVIRTSLQIPGVPRLPSWVSFPASTRLVVADLANPSKQFLLL